MNSTNKQEQIWNSLRDLKFRKQFIDEHITVGIAFQIRALRDRQQLTQAKLAKLLKIKQPLLSSWENPNYGKYTLGTLKDLAKAFDVGLLVRFVPFSTLADWAVNLSNDTIAPPSFDEEEQNQILGLIASTDIRNNLDANSLVDFHLVQTPNTLPSTTGNNPKELIHA